MHRKGGVRVAFPDVASRARVAPGHRRLID
jgi:hypothetical protein